MGSSKNFFAGTGNGYPEVLKYFRECLRKNKKNILEYWSGVPIGNSDFWESKNRDRKSHATVPYNDLPYHAACSAMLTLDNWNSPNFHFLSE